MEAESIVGRKRKEGIEEAYALKLFRQLIEGMCYMNAKGNPTYIQAKCTGISSLTTF